MKEKEYNDSPENQAAELAIAAMSDEKWKGYLATQERLEQLHREAGDNLIKLRYTMQLYRALAQAGVRRKDVLQFNYEFIRQNKDGSWVAVKPSYLRAIGHVQARESDPRPYAVVSVRLKGDGRVVPIVPVRVPPLMRRKASKPAPESDEAA